MWWVFDDTCGGAQSQTRKHTGIEVVFTRSIIEYRINGETCVCCLFMVCPGITIKVKV